MKDKIVLITGASSGVGKALAVEASGKGARVIIICRDKISGENALEDICRISGKRNVELLTADLSLMSEVRKAAGEFKSKYNRLDILINNAATSAEKREITSEGLEKTFATNHIAYYLLTNLLLDIIRKSAPSRIINVASQAHKTIDFDNLQAEKKFNGFTAYGYSKMGNIMFTYDLAGKLSGSGVTVNVVHPGVVRTNIYRHVRRVPKFIIKGIFWWFFITPEKSASDIIYLAESKEVENVTGKYFAKRKIRDSKPQSYDVQARNRLMEISKNLTGITL